MKSEKFCHNGIAYKNEENSKFYDEIYMYSEEYKKDFLNSLYYSLYKNTFEIILKKSVTSILEVACGVGTFATMLHCSNFKGKYIGFDFSKVGVEKARLKCPQYTFLCENIYTTNLFFSVDYDTVIMHEVLEHLQDDIGTLRKIKHNSFIIASVPQFDFKSHVRFFKDEKQIVYRYGRCIDIEKIFHINNIFLFYGKICKPSSL